MKYLRVTIHDNDFSTELELMGNLVKTMFDWWGHFPTEDELDMVAPLIQNLFYDTYKMNTYLRGSGGLVDKKYFYPTLEFIEFEDIPYDDNDESIYIPLIDGCDVLRL